MKQKLFKKIIVFGATLLMLGSAQIAYALGGQDNFSGLSALDTVAGFETLVRAEGLNSGQSVVFTVRGPDGNSFSVSSVADDTGRASAAVPDTETQRAGEYGIIIKGISGVASFTVFPGEMDVRSSGVYSDKTTVAADGTSYANITVRVVDDFGNPLEYHEVKLASSRNADRIIEPTGDTNKDGTVSFLVTSKEPGISTFIATDESAGENIMNRPVVTFYRSSGAGKGAVGGDPRSFGLASVLLAQAGTVSEFEIDSLPASAAPNERIDFRVTAVDSGGNIVPSYRGTITFSSTDNNAQLPSDYTFQPSDQGRKTFDLGLSFRATGPQVLTVEQENNRLITGEAIVEILAGEVRGSGAIRITKPATGTYSVNTLEVAGEASPYAVVRIFDNATRIAEVTSGANGRFSYNTSLLTDGQHTFYAESDGVQSDSVVATIDSTPARIEQVAITTTNLAPGESTEISIRSDPDLSSVQATVGEFITDLEFDPQNPGMYRGTLVAPAQDGEYIINVILVDALGNESGMQEVGRLRVDASLQQTPTTFSVPSTVQGVTAIPGNGRVTLTWQAAQADAGIAFYRIYYGSDLTGGLNLIANTIDPNTTWYIPNLQNDTRYSFQLVGVDANGNESDNRSQTVSATPSAGASDTDFLVLCDPGPCPPDVSPPPATPQDGPDVIGMIVASLMGGGALRFFRKKKTLP